MPEVLDQPVTETSTGNQPSQTPGWIAGLPDELKAHEEFKSYRTVGDFAKAHLDTAKKAKELEGKLGNSIPKLGENATQEERDRFYNSLGRPEKPDGYKFAGEDKAAPEWTKAYKDAMYRIGVPAAMATQLSEFNNSMINQMVEQHNARILSENAAAAATLKTELGDKYDASVALVSRLWKQWGGTEVDFDKAFASETSQNRVTMIRFLLNVAAKTGEDSSLKGSGMRQQGPKPGYDLSKFNLPPARV
jgi:hypothetical protein